MGLIFTYVMTYGGSVVALFNPFIGLLIYICFGIIKPELMWRWSVPQGNYSRTIAIALLIGWAMNGFGNWRFGRARGIVIAFVGFFLWSLISALQAIDPEYSFDGFIEPLSKILLPFLVGITVIKTPAQLRQLAWVLVLSVGFIALRQNEVYFSGSFYERDNMTAHTVMICTGMAFLLAVSSPRLWQKALAFLLAALMAHAVMIHESRGAMLATLVIGLTVFWLLPKKPAHVLLFAAGVIVALFMAGPQVRARFETTFASDQNRDSSAQSRFDLWRDMFDVAKKHPVFGVGPLNWHRIAHTYGWPPGKDGHGLWVQLAAELGFIGSGLLLFFYSSCILKSWPSRAYWQADETGLVLIAQMVVVSLVGFMVGQMFGSFSSMELPYYVGLLGAGALKLVSQQESISQKQIDWAEPNEAPCGWQVAQEF